MKARFSWLSALVFVPHAALALDLTPFQTFRELEGVRIPVVQFADGTRKVTYQPPGQWRVSGGGESVQFFPANRDQAIAQLRVCARPTVPEGGDATAFDTWARAFLPPAASEIAKEGECAGQFTLGTETSREVTFSYSLSGRRFLMSVAAVELNERERLAVVVNARQPDFPAVHEEAIASLFSWQWND